MPRISLGFPVLITVAIAGGIAARLFWDATANRQEAPIWVPILVGFLVITVGLAFKVQVDRRALCGLSR
ncbi:hypothetical protein [Streptomyces sp. SP18CM02]|uniref:hypothetical protein n=1 Tax=Streptomyces sp. SP18CM02 TaxID=2758571 RepID=UPI00168B3417|nr:hypothetical protein [Streptomyces sp. SP18CM02]MBD3550829.1 hypothetical protein [Streptomyces sp. SP18CM02]